MNYTEIEIDWMKEILRDKEEEIKKLKSDLSLVIKERDDNIEQNKKLFEEIGQLEEENRSLKADWERWYRHLTRAEIDKIINDY